MTHTLNGSDEMEVRRTKACQGALIIAAVISRVGCGATARLAVSDGMGPKAVLPAPQTSLTEYRSAMARQCRRTWTIWS